MSLHMRRVALRGLSGPGGAPEVSSGIPSPPSSPPLAAKHASARRGGAAYTITGECERLFCETLRSVFLGEGSQTRQDSLVMGMFNNDTTADLDSDYGFKVDDQAVKDVGHGTITDWIEMWDYVGGIQFRGFVAEKDGERAMFVFFDQSVVAGDLKAGLMALLELCAVPHFSCDRLVVCIDRHAEPTARDTLVKDLGWIGFSLTTLDDFSDGAELTSDKWLFMDMET
ncbi:ornithine decarboxylase antizyme-domain-containing protein [Paraphoma chrysanthemicola]|nr:ornithine decarboxylase antizyme-domain-containing protein [Paraphoma chrysanthemicola]